MKTATIEELAYVINEAKENGSSPIFFLGAGASRSGGIPLAAEIVADILENHSNNPRIKNIKDEDKTYPSLMECLGPHGRNKLLKGYIDSCKINVTHIYLAQLMKQGYADYVLTVNFDNLMLRALALFDEFPSTYDMAILKDLTTTTFKEKSVIYLHGQHHGLWLLNTQEEMAKVKEIVPPILHSIKNERPWVFIGYSGEDPIFQHIKDLGRFDNGLYWVSYNNNDPCSSVCSDLLDKSNTNAFVIKDYDSDSFMLRLNSELGLGQPQIIDKPFSSLSSMLNNIVDIDDEEHFKGVKERLEVVKEQVAESILKFEEGKVESSVEINAKTEIDLLKKEIIDLIIAEDYQEEKIAGIVSRSESLKDEEITELIVGLYYNWGHGLVALAATKQGGEAETLYQEAFEKYQQAIEIKPDDHQALYNWGHGLGALAAIKQGGEAETLYQEAFEKYRQAVEIKPGKHQAFNNWGHGLGALAATKSGDEAEALYQEAFEKYRQAIEIKPDDHQVLYNWGTTLLNWAKTKSGVEAKALFEQSLEKLNQAVALGGQSYNLACVYSLRSEKEQALLYLSQSLENKEIEPAFVIEDEDWAGFVEDEDFKKIISKYQ